MEGYLVRIPNDAWLGDSATHAPRKRASRRGRQAQLLYYELGEGYLRGYASPDDIEPVQEFQLTSFHVEVDAMYSMFMFQVFTTSKGAGTGGAIPTNSIVVKGTKGGAVSDDSSDDSSDEGDDDDGADTRNGGSSREASILLFAANKALVQTWATRVLNWNRYVFGGTSGDDEPSAEALEASKRELLETFQSHCCASWFSRPLSLDAHPSSQVSDKRDIGGDTSASNSQPPTDPTKLTAAATLVPSKPWWTLGAPQTRRISASSLRK